MSYNKSPTSLRELCSGDGDKLYGGRLLLVGLESCVVDETKDCKMKCLFPCLDRSFDLDIHSVRSKLAASLPCSVSMYSSWQALIPLSSFLFVFAPVQAHIFLSLCFPSFLSSLVPAEAAGEADSLLSFIMSRLVNRILNYSLEGFRK